MRLRVTITGIGFSMAAGGVAALAAALAFGGGDAVAAAALAAGCMELVLVSVEHGGA